ncbi:MAG: DNA-directed RNA polymerase subunit alpha [Candidatus Buchananbacteria bacterium]
MENIPLAQKISEEVLEDYKSRIIFEPLYPGYGNTLGNALRRVLLSSLPGAAVIAVKIKGAQHEFSTIEHVAEDVVEIILNLKQLRLRVFSDEPVKIFLRAKGERAVTAKDIEVNSDVEVVNKNLHIATLTSPKGELEMELTVQQGRGYVPTESRDKEKVELGAIIMDAIYTPIKNVGFKVEATRVGQRTDYDKLILEIETDGSIKPQEALKQATKILLEQLNWVDENIEESGRKKKVEKKEEAVEEAAEEVAEEVAAEDEETEDDSKAKKKRGRPKKED